MRLSESLEVAFLGLFCSRLVDYCSKGNVTVYGKGGESGQANGSGGKQPERLFTITLICDHFQRRRNDLELPIPLRPL